MGKFVRKDIEKTPNSFFYTPKRFISKAEAFSLKERDVFILSIRLNCAVVWAESCGRFRRVYIQKTAEDYCRARGIRNYLQPQQSGKPV